MAKVLIASQITPNYKFVDLYVNIIRDIQLQVVDMFSHDRILAHVAFFPEQIAEQVVEGMGGKEILNRTKDGHKAKGDLEQWKVLLL